MTSLNQLARRLRLSKATVSRALRNEPHVAEKTRNRVMKAAKQYGYEPSFAMSAAMSAAGSRGKVRYRETIGVLTGGGSLANLDAAGRKPFDYRRRLLFRRGLLERAEELGCAIDFHELPETKLDHLLRVLDARGISRLIIAPGLGLTAKRALPAIERLQRHLPSVLLGFRELGWDLNAATCQADYYMAGRQAFLRAWQAGYDRILVGAQLMMLNLDNRFIAGLYEGCRASQSDVEIEITSTHTRKGKLPSEKREAGEETCIISGISPHTFAELEVLLAKPQAPGWIDWHANLFPRLDLTGIDQRDDHQARQCVDLCLSAIGEDPAEAAIGRNLLVEPGWIEGNSLKVRQRPHNGLGRCLRFPSTKAGRLEPLPLPASLLSPKKVIQRLTYPQGMPLPRAGQSTFHHVPFEIPRGCPLVLTRDQRHPKFRKSSSIKCDGTAIALYFLHTVIYCREKRAVGAYTLHYEDGHSAVITVQTPEPRNGAMGNCRHPAQEANIRDWWPDDSLQLENEATLPVRLVDADNPMNQLGYLSVHRWVNPRPGERIKSINLVCHPEGNHNLLLFGITLER